MERDLERGKPFFPTEEREGKELRRLRPQGPGGFVRCSFWNVCEDAMRLMIIRVMEVRICIQKMHLGAMIILAQVSCVTIFA